MSWHWPPEDVPINRKLRYVSYHCMCMFVFGWPPCQRSNMTLMEVFQLTLDLLYFLNISLLYDDATFCKPDMVFVSILVEYSLSVSTMYWTTFPCCVDVIFVQWDRKYIPVRKPVTITPHNSTMFIMLSVDEAITLRQEVQQSIIREIRRKLKTPVSNYIFVIWRNWGSCVHATKWCIQIASINHPHDIQQSE